MKPKLQSLEQIAKALEAMLERIPTRMERIQEAIYTATLVNTGHSGTPLESAELSNEYIRLADIAAEITKRLLHANGPLGK